MLRNSVYTVLEELGLQHLADVQLTLYRYDEELHRENPCPLPVPNIWHSPTARTRFGVLRTSVRELDGDICSCVWQHPDLGKLNDVRVLARLLNSYPRGKAPTGRSFMDLNRISRMLMAAEQTLDMLRWSRFATQDPEILEAVAESRRTVEAEREHYLALLQQYGGEVSREYAVAELVAEVEPATQALGRVLGRSSAKEALAVWKSLVYRGHDRERRRLVMSKVLGGTCVADLRTYGTPGEVEEAVQHLREALALLEELEDRMEWRKGQVPGLRLATVPIRGNVYESGMVRVALEAVTAARTRTTRLVVIPDDTLGLYAHQELLHETVLPNDPQLLETVTKLWEGDEDTILSHPRTLVEAAKLL